MGAAFVDVVVNDALQERLSGTPLALSRMERRLFFVLSAPLHAIAVSHGPVAARAHGNQLEFFGTFFLRFGGRSEGARGDSE